MRHLKQPTIQQHSELIDEGIFDKIKQFVGNKPAQTTEQPAQQDNDANTLVKQWFNNGHPSSKTDNSMPMVCQYSGNAEKRNGNSFSTYNVCGFPGIQFSAATTKTTAANKFYVRITKPLYSKQVEGITPVTKELAAVFKQAIMSKKDERITNIYTNIAQGHCNFLYLQKVADFLIKNDLGELYTKLYKTIIKHFDGIIYTNEKNVACYVVFNKSQILPVKQ
jgi:hypothetical protein